MKRTVLSALHEARGACWMEHHGWEIPARYAEVQAEYQALQEGVGLIDLSYRTLLKVTGRDRRTWLHGQVTQDIVHLPEGRGAYATIMTPQGRMVSDLSVFALGDALLLDFPAGTDVPPADYLNRYLIMERAEIEELSEGWALLSLQGPQSPCALSAVLGQNVSRMEAWQIREECYQDNPLYVARVGHCGEDGYDLYVPAASAPSLWGSLCQHRAEFAVHSVGWEALNIRRLEAGIPWWGEELDGTIVPLEARLDRAIHPEKGCYVGQEIIARLHARGHVNNLLAGFRVLEDALPARGSEIHHGGRKVGRVSTALQSLRLQHPIALGYLRRELQDQGTRVQAMTADGAVELEVVPLPFVPDDWPGAAQS